MTPTGIDNDINSVLNEFFSKQTEVYDSAIREKYNNDSLIKHLLLSGIVETFDTAKNSYILTPFGFEVIRAGGWIAHLEEQEQDKRANRQLIASSIRTNWLQKWLLIATTVFSFITLGVSTADITIHRKELQVAREELRLHKLESEKQSPVLSPCPSQECKTCRQFKQKADSLVKTK